MWRLWQTSDTMCPWNPISNLAPTGLLDRVWVTISLKLMSLLSPSPKFGEYIFQDAIQLSPKWKRICIICNKLVSIITLGIQRLVPSNITNLNNSRLSYRWVKDLNIQLICFEGSSIYFNHIQFHQEDVFNLFITFTKFVIPLNDENGI